MKNFFQEFKEFAMRGNVLDMAVGVVVGSAFTAIVTSIVQNLLTPLLGLLIPDSTFAEWAPGGFGIGAVINSIISFLITAFVVFVLVKAVNRLTAKKKKEEEPKPEPPKGPTTEELLVEIRDLLKQQEEDAKKKELAGDVKASWGDQMRSYVLNPYQMVKDLRTNFEVGNPDSVFDGDIDGFIDAGIRWRKQQETAED